MVDRLDNHKRWKCTRGRKEREKKRGIEEIFEAVVTGSFPKLMSDTKPQLQEVQRASRANAKHKTHKTLEI
jgi:hypothetical protein